MPEIPPWRGVQSSLRPCPIRQEPVLRPPRRWGCCAAPRCGGTLTKSQLVPEDIHSRSGRRPLRSSSQPVCCHSICHSPPQSPGSRKLVLEFATLVPCSVPALLRQG